MFLKWFTWHWAGDILQTVRAELPDFVVDTTAAEVRDQVVEGLVVAHLPWVTSS